MSGLTVLPSVPPLDTCFSESAVTPISSCSLQTRYRDQSTNLSSQVHRASKQPRTPPEIKTMIITTILARRGSNAVGQVTLESSITPSFMYVLDRSFL